MINGSICKISRSRRKNVRREYELCNEAVEVFVNIFQAFAITYYLIKCLGVKEGKNRKCAYITGVIVTVLYLEIMNRIIFLRAWECLYI